MTSYGVRPQVESHSERVCHRVFAKDSLKVIFERLSIIKSNIGILHCTTPLALFVAIVEHLHCNSMHTILSTCGILESYLPSMLDSQRRKFSPRDFLLLWQPDICHDLPQIIAPILNIIPALVRVPCINYCTVDALYALLLIWVLHICNVIHSGKVFQIFKQKMHKLVPDIIPNQLQKLGVFFHMEIVGILLWEISGEVVCIHPHTPSPILIYFPPYLGKEVVLNMNDVLHCGR